MSEWLQGMVFDLCGKSLAVAFVLSCLCLVFVLCCLAIDTVGNSMKDNVMRSESILGRGSSRNSFFPLLLSDKCFMCVSPKLVSFVCLFTNERMDQQINNAVGTFEHSKNNATECPMMMNE